MLVVGVDTAAIVNYYCYRVWLASTVTSKVFKVDKPKII